MAGEFKFRVPRVAEATLVVRFEDGETVPATEDHLKQLGYVNALDAYHEISLVLQEAVGVIDLTAGSTSKANLIRYLVETGIVFDTSHFDQDLRNELRELLREEGSDRHCCGAEDPDYRLLFCDRRAGHEGEHCGYDCGQTMTWMEMDNNKPLKEDGSGG